jgi:hypothetical protein
LGNLNIPSITVFRPSGLSRPLRIRAICQVSTNPTFGTWDSSDSFG